MTKNIWNILVLLAMLLALACNQVNEPKPKKVEAPLVSFSSIEPLFHKNNDTTYVFNFWATWCKPCVAELPYFEELNKKMQDQPFKLYLFSLDFTKQIDSKLIPFMEKHQLTGEVMVIQDPDANSWIDRIDPSWSGAIPATLIVKGDKRKFHEGELASMAEIESLIKNI